MSEEASQRFSLWVEFTDRGEVLRADYPGKSDAIFNAKKYWLTSTGLFRAFVRDAAEGGAIVFDRVCEARATTDVTRIRESYGQGEDAKGDAHG